MSIRAVLFDLDDTLYGDFETCDRLGLEAAGRYAESAIGIPASVGTDAMQRGRLQMRALLHGEPESHDRTLFAKLGLEQLGINPIAHAEAMHEAYWSAVLDAMQRREGVTELLTSLQQAGIAVGICTNMTADIQMRKLCRLGLAELCGQLISSEEAGQDKPSPEIFHMALDRLKVPAAQTLMVGDNFHHDVLGALAVNMQGLWLNIKHKTETAPRPFFSAHSFPDAAAQIQKLCGL